MSEETQPHKQKLSQKNIQEGCPSIDHRRKGSVNPSQKMEEQDWLKQENEQACHGRLGALQYDASMRAKDTR